MPHDLAGANPVAMPATAMIEIAVLWVQPIGRGRLLALTSVELAIDGVCCVVHGLQVLRLRPAETGDDATGVKLQRPTGDAVLERCCELQDSGTVERMMMS